MKFTGVRFERVVQGNMSGWFHAPRALRCGLSRERPTIKKLGKAKHSQPYEIISSSCVGYGGVEEIGSQTWRQAWTTSAIHHSLSTRLMLPWSLSYPIQRQHRSSSTVILTEQQIAV